MKDEKKRKPWREFDAGEVDAAREFYMREGPANRGRIICAMRDAGWTQFAVEDLRGAKYRNFPGLEKMHGWREEWNEHERGRVEEERERRRAERLSAQIALQELAAREAARRMEMQPLPEDETSAAERSSGVDFPTWLAAGPRPAQLAFPDWLMETTTSGWRWDWPHQLYLYQRLDRVTRGDCKRLMISMPPRHSKSETVTIRYTAWRLEMDPGLNIILGSYNQKLANRFSRKIRRIVEERMNLAKDRKAVDEWETPEGGGVRAVGVGAGVTGFGADLVIVDDPIKSRADAESKNNRERVWNWFSDDIYTRLEPDAGIILIQTRWHEDDLAGRLLKQSTDDDAEEWEVVELPALAEARNADAFVRNGRSAATHGDGDAGHGDGDNGSHGLSDEASLNAGKSARVPLDPLGRTPGEALWPERFDEKRLAKIRRQLGSYSFSALYQQQPVPSDGGIFKRSWFGKIVERAPDGLRWARGYDLAISLRSSADYTASFRCAFDKRGNLYIADGFRRRIDYPEQRRFVLERMRAEPGTLHGIEDALHGKALVQDLRRDALGRGSAFRAVTVAADKLTRSLVWAPLAEEGKVFLVQGCWIDEFITEACGFPRGRHDDQIDAVSLAVQMLKPGRGKMHIFE